jgi:hypothetical protein
MISEMKIKKNIPRLAKLKESITSDVGKHMGKYSHRARKQTVTIFVKGM